MVERERQARRSSVPPTIQALLAARLDQLGDGERRCSSAAPSRAQVFHRGAVQALAPEPSATTSPTRPRSRSSARSWSAPTAPTFAGDEASASATC